MGLVPLPTVVAFRRNIRGQNRQLRIFSIKLDWSFMAAVNTMKDGYAQMQLKWVLDRQHEW